MKNSLTSNIKAATFQEFLVDSLNLRQQKNHRYSVRRFSSELKIHSSTLSLYLRGRRPVSITHMESMGQILGLHPQEIIYYQLEILLRPYWPMTQNPKVLEQMAELINSLL